MQTAQEAAERTNAADMINRIRLALDMIEQDTADSMAHCAEHRSGGLAYALASIVRDNAAILVAIIERQKR